jgi:competence protein ComEA
MLKKILAAFVMLCAAVAMAAVDVNKASEADLDNVKGIGPVTSKLIMAERKKAPFKNWEDFISRVTGIGETRAAKLSEDGLTVNGRSFKAASAAKAGDKKEAKKDTKAAAADSKPADTSKAGAADSKPAGTSKTAGADAKPAAAATPTAPAAAAAPANAAASAAKK